MDAEKPREESGAARGGPASCSSLVTVTPWVSAQGAGRKRVAELALALLTHRPVPESNQHLVFTEHLPWEAGNPLPSLACVSHCGVFTLALGFISSPFTSAASKHPKEQVSVPHLTPACPSKKAPGEHDLSTASWPLHFLLHLWPLMGRF